MSYMNSDQAKALVERFAKVQGDGDYLCPRCGKDTMTARPALSRRATVSVCDRCGVAEALEDMAPSQKVPLEEWAICKKPEVWGLITSPGVSSTGGLHITISGHIGTWYVIDEGDFVLTPDTDDGKALTIPAHLYLLEHEEYGDEAAHIIVNEDGKVVLDDVWNGFDDLLEAGWAEA